MKNMDETVLNCNSTGDFEGYTYFVVKLDSSLEYPERYACVPRHWVRHFEADNNMVFRYPARGLSDAKQLFKQECLNAWPLRLGHVNSAHRHDELDEALSLLAIMDDFYKKVEALKSKKGKSLYIPNVSNHTVNDIDTSKNQDTNEINDHNEEEMTNESKDSDDEYIPSSGESDLEDDYVNKKDNRKIKKVENNTDAGHDEALLKELQRQNSCLKQLHDQLKLLSDQHAKLLQKIEKQALDSGSKKQDNTPKLRRKSTLDSERVTKRRKSVKVQHNVIEQKAATPNIVKRLRFSLPPEYDPNDTRWTLRYRNAGPGLQELIPGTGVYINSYRFHNCKHLAKDEKSLARLLLVEIFSDTALATCSLTGARATAFDYSGDEVRPGLDERARNVLLNFVEDYCNEKQWVSSDRQSIKRSLRCKIQDLRSKTQ